MLKDIIIYNYNLNKLVVKLNIKRYLSIKICFVKISIYVKYCYFYFRLKYTFKLAKYLFVLISALHKMIIKIYYRLITLIDNIITNYFNAYILLYTYNCTFVYLVLNFIIFILRITAKLFSRSNWMEIRRSFCKRAMDNLIYYATSSLILAFVYDG